VPIALGALLGQHYDLSARLVPLHAAMRLNDLIQVEGPADLDVQTARHDLLGQFLERRQRLIYAYPVCSQNPEIRRALADPRNRALQGRQKRAIRLLSDFYGITLFRARSRYFTFVRAYFPSQHGRGSRLGQGKLAWFARPARRNRLSNVRPAL
jgi:hypothetical protein